MRISTSSDFSTYLGGLGSLGQGATTYYGLLSNVTYYFEVKHSTDSVYSAAVSSATDPAVPEDGGLGVTGEDAFYLSWTEQTNFPGTRYLAEAGADEGFIAIISSETDGTGAEIGGLNPDTTYYARVTALGVAGKNSDPRYIGNAVTLAYPPSSAVYALVSSTGLSVFWSRNGNPDWTKFYLEASSDTFATVSFSSMVYADYYEAAGLLPNTGYQFKARAVNGNSVNSVYYNFPSTVTAAALPAGPVTLTPGDNSVNVLWDGNNNPLDTEYLIRASTAADFSGNISNAGWAALPVRDFTGLNAGLTYFFQAKARNREGRETAYYALGSALVNSGTDIMPPVVDDAQDGDDTWRGSPNGLYRVHFSDLGSRLARFQVSVDTGIGFTPTVISTWTNVMTNMNLEEYNTDWELPTAVFEAIPQGVTSYVSVRVYDSSGNVTVAPDVFYVLRDTTTPDITGSVTSPAAWLGADPGTFSGLTFSDGLSSLAQVLYSASNQAGMGNANVLGWTPIATFASSPTYSEAWGVNFAALEDGASNYISVRAVDRAGNPYTRKDVLRLLKNTVGPNVTITSPAGLYVSTITALEGTALPMNDQSPPAYAEISLQDLTDPASNYYNGVSFGSASEAWLRAQGQTSWSFDVSTIAFAPASQYRVSARAWDGSGRVTRTPFPGVSFRFSQSVPTIAMSTPVAGSTVSAFAEISGTAADGGGAGLSEIEVFIKRISDSKWWNPVTGAWGETLVASATAASVSWTFAPGALMRGALAHGQDYFVTARVRDAAAPANYSAFAVPGATFTCVDTYAPQAVTQFTASTGTLPGRINISWTFAGDDGLGLPIPFGDFVAQYSTNPAAVFSTGAAQVLISTGLVTAGSAQYYTVTGLNPGVTYYLTLWTKDDAGLWSGPSPLRYTIAGESLNDQISGTVKTPSGAGVTAVLVEAFDGDGLLTSEAYTQDDGQGSFTLLYLLDGFYRVQATSVEGGFSSSIAKDLIPMGYADTDFVLSTDYALASVSGTIPAATVAGLRPASVTGGEVQLWRGGRKLAAARADAAGRFSIGNLIPGGYTLKVKDGAGTWRSFEISLAEGQALEVTPLGTLLRKDAVYVYPNPAGSYAVFHVETGIYPARAELSVFSVDGTLVRHADEAVPLSKVYEYRWEFSGSRPASGVYFYSVRVKNGLTGEVETTTKKFAVIR
ncbi:MAG TPA: hypothetical protein DCZ92_00935 [Elusimicrobia bacterium]|nr:MAG: hypothetical protein A2016_04630 [Elusimicrobia bacterium GWF2_62_30]HBA59391.1 hypothetical protein [Elusimicrobiota bacterium]